MEKEKRRIRLSANKQEEILKKFMQEQGKEEFGRDDLRVWLSSQFEWFRSLSETAKASRISDFISRIKKISGDKFRVLSRGGGKESVFKISDEPEPIKTPKRKYTEKFKRLYILIGWAYNSPIGVSKKDASKILNYKSDGISMQGLESINNQIKAMTGYSPFTMDKSHTFTDYDILEIDKEAASLILEEYEDDLGGLELKNFKSSFVEEVKTAIKSDYNILRLFKESGEIKFSTGDADKLRKYMFSTVTAGTSDVAEKFQRLLKTRYNADLKIIGHPRYGFEIESWDALDLTLDRIKALYENYFGEEIIPTKTVEEKEVSEKEEVMISIIEQHIFHGKDGKMYLSELWKRLDEIEIKRGWDLLRLLKKSEEFKIEQHSGTYGLEYLITFSPKPIIYEEEKKEIIANKEEPDTTTTIIYKALVGVKERGGLASILNPREKQKFAEDYFLYSIEVNMKDREAVLEYLKLYWSTPNTVIELDDALVEDKLKKILIS